MKYVEGLVFKADVSDIFFILKLQVMTINFLAQLLELFRLLFVLWMALKNNQSEPRSLELRQEAEEHDGSTDVPSRVRRPSSSRSSSNCDEKLFL